MFPQKDHNVSFTGMQGVKTSISSMLWENGQTVVAAQPVLCQSNLIMGS